MDTQDRRYELFLDAADIEPEAASNTTFVMWIIDRLAEWRDRVGRDRGLPMCDEDHRRFDEWLENSTGDVKELA